MGVQARQLRLAGAGNTGKNSKRCPFRSLERCVECGEEALVEVEAVILACLMNAIKPLELVDVRSGFSRPCVCAQDIRYLNLFPRSSSPAGVP